MGNQSISHGSLIARYLQESAAEEGIDKMIKFRHQVNRMSWSTTSKTWSLEVTKDERDIETLCTRFVLLGTGYYDYHTPLETKIPGIENFQGQVIHPQFWPTDFDCRDKKVVIVGSGATAITLLPSIAQTSSHVTMPQRSPSYILSIPSEDTLEKAIRLLCPRPLARKLIRLKWIVGPLVLVSFCRRMPRLARWILLHITSKQLPQGTPLAPDFTPRYNPWEQRLCMCPDSDFYECIRNGTGSVKTDLIDSVTEKTIRLTSGHELNPDIIVTATGLKLCVAGGIEIIVDGELFRVSDHFLWKGAVLENLPNVVFSFGYIDASWTLGADATAKLACRLLTQMQKDGATMIAPRLTEEEKRDISEVPFLNLSATYVERSPKLFPKVGGKSQWARRSYYWKDLAVAIYGNIKEGMEWSK